jgi:uroporphyrinogen-III synthase
MAEGPLDNLRILLTRAEVESRALADVVRSLGGRPIIFPCIEFAMPEDLALVKHAVFTANSYDYILFSSPTAVRIFCVMMDYYGQSNSRINKPNVIALGKKTAEIAMQRGFKIWYAAEGGSADSLLDDLMSKEWEFGFEGRRILLPRSGIALALLSARLAELGLQVDDTVFYRTTTPERPDKSGLNEITSGGVDYVAFFSPSAVTGLARLLRPDILKDVQNTSHAVVLGGTTRRAAEDAGFRIAVESGEHSSEGLINALVKFVENGN